MARERRGRTLVEDVFEALRSDILFGRRLPSSRLQLNEIAEEHGVSLGVVREAVTRLASEDLLEATPQRGFCVRSISLDDLHDLTWVRIQLETLALRESIAKGDVSWEANLVAAHHRLVVTPPYLTDGTGNGEWMAAHGEFHTALTAAAGSPNLERLRRQLYNASELYRYWVANLPHDPLDRDVPDEHKAIVDAALARDADTAVRLLTEHLETTERNLVAIAPGVVLEHGDASAARA
jgi:GntR family transcriptional regulator, carbon starvation induced regulator